MMDCKTCLYYKTCPAADFIVDEPCETYRDASHYKEFTWLPGDEAYRVYNHCIYPVNITRTSISVDAEGCVREFVDYYILTGDGDKTEFKWLVDGVVTEDKRIYHKFGQALEEYNRRYKNGKD